MPREENVVLEDVDIIFRNFEGREGMYNRAGDRNFAVKLDKATADALSNAGWNVKQLRQREEDDEPQPYLSVTVGFKGRPPLIKLITSRGDTSLDEETVEVLDAIDIKHVDLIIRPYDWAVSGNTGRKAYLQSLYVTQLEDALQLKYGQDLGVASVDGPMMMHTEPYVPEL
jgi:hypothetical protein